MIDCDDRVSDRAQGGYAFQFALADNHVGDEQVCDTTASHDFGFRHFRAGDSNRSGTQLLVCDGC